MLTALSRLLLLLLFCLASAMPTMANELYRCVDAHGSVSYQSQTCATRQRLDRVVAYQAEPASTQTAALSQRDPYRSITNVRRRPHTTQTRGGHEPTASSRCRQARVNREKALERIGLHRNYDQLSRLDAGVRRQCRW